MSAADPDLVADVVVGALDVALGVAELDLDEGEEDEEEAEEHGAPEHPGKGITQGWDVMLIGQ